MTAPSPFVSTEWLAANLGAPGLMLVDGSWHMPASGRSGHAEYLEHHIPGAVFFDLDAISDPATDLPHMLPTAEAFAAAVGALGIGDDARIVVYDSAGLFSAPRVWWTFKAFGARDVAILEGGLPKWLAEGRPTESGAVVPTPATFSSAKDGTIVATISQVEDALTDGTTQVLDARSAERFAGTAPDPRPGLSSGAMPGSLNLPFGQILKGGALVSQAEIRLALEGAGVDLDRPVITSCGSGVTAAILWVALESIGKPPIALYDGSWTEWASSGKAIAKA